MMWYGQCDGRGCEDADRRLWPAELARTGIGDERLCVTCSWLRSLAVDMLRDEMLADPRQAGTDSYGSVCDQARRALTIAAARAALTGDTPEAMRLAMLASER